MTWLKTSDDYPDDCARAGLSDAAYRTHHEALSWTMRRETGGAISVRDVRRFAETTDPDAAIAELVACGFWEPDDDGYRIVHHMDHQPTPDELEQRRALRRERDRRYRARRLEQTTTPETTRRTSHRTSRPTGTGRVGSGTSPESLLTEVQRSQLRKNEDARARDEPPPTGQPCAWCGHDLTPHDLESESTVHANGCPA